MIRTAILQGRFGEAMKLINTHFPGMLQQEGRGQELCLWLKQSEFVELMRDYTTRKSDSNSMEVDDIDLLNRVMQYGKDLREEYRHDTQEKTRSSLVVYFYSFLFAPYLNNHFNVARKYFLYWPIQTHTQVPLLISWIHQKELQLLQKPMQLF